MELQELDSIFKIDFNNLPRFYQDRPPVYKNIIRENLSLIVFNNLTKFFPELKKTSPALNHKIRISICFAYGETNTDNQPMNPTTFQIFLKNFLMSAMTFKPENEADKLFLWKYTQMRATNQYQLAS